MADTTTAASLGAKLEALDLTADEHALLADLLTPADAEVSGYNQLAAGMTLRVLVTTAAAGYAAGSEAGRRVARSLKSGG